MASPYAFVTLVSSDSYLPGALALSAALKDVHPSPPLDPEVLFQTVCLVTPETVDVSTIKLLRRAFDFVIGVEIIEQDNVKNLMLLGRLDLKSVLTKLHIFRLTQYSKIIFLDADVLPIRPISHLFNIPHEFSAVPDVGWPDIFNSGVMVVTPGEDKFQQLDELLKSRGSWDGGDQGILNEWRGNNWNRLSFTYNTTPTAAYTYAPAYERYGSHISAIHFIGPNKPWNSITVRPPFSTQQSSKSDMVSSVEQSYDYQSLVDRWYAVYDKHYRSQPIVSTPLFEIQRYASVWDDKTTYPNASSTSNVPGNVLGLEELRRLAIEGLGASGGSSDRYPGEGEYKSLPLNGRVDLMRPQKLQTKEGSSMEILFADDQGKGRGDVLEFEEAPSTPLARQITFQDDPLQWSILFTPGPDEIPPSPRIRLRSLPPTPTPQPYYNSSSAYESEASEGVWRNDSHQPNLGSRETFPENRQVAESDSLRPHRQHDHDQSREVHYEGRHLSNERETRTEQGKPAWQEVPSGHDIEVRSMQELQTSQLQSHQDVHGRPDHQHGHSSSPMPQDSRGEGQKYRHPVQDVKSHSPPKSEEPRRPSSPPLLVWNPAVEPPPKTTPIPSAFPADTYFPNIWDQTSSRKQDASHTATLPLNTAAFFQPPPPSEIPESLVRQGHYRNVTGEEILGATPSPDRSKIKTVFPWEDKPRHLPGRVFPEFDAPSPALFLSPSSQSSTAAPSTPETKAIPIRTHQLSPLHGLPNSLTYSNAWDTVPSIQKYASRLARPPPLPVLAPAFDDNHWKRKSWDEKTEASSRDGDDEDNADDEDDAPAPDDSDRESSRTSKIQRSRSGSSVSLGHSIKSKKKEYRTRGVQTIPREKRSQAVQVNINPLKERRLSIPGKRHWPSSSPGLFPLPTHEISIGTDQPMSTILSTPTTEVPNPPILKLSPPSSSPSLMSPLRSPREFIASPASSVPRQPAKALTPPLRTNSPVKMTTPPLKPSSIRTTNFKSPASVSRQISNDSSIGSPLSSVGPLSPPDVQAISSPLKKGSRVWDPARGVELFKRGSEEVLARFLKMGSWEEENVR